jgi:protein-tyrosine phosphatase
LSAAPPSARFCILSVCTGNVCRSPYAALLLRAAIARLGWADGVEVISAGTEALRGAVIAPQMAVLAGDVVVDVTSRTACQLDRLQAEQADLVLAMTRNHRRETALLVPAKSRVSFTLNEFARLTEDARAAGLLRFKERVPVPEMMSTFVRIVASRRGFAVPPADLADDDIPDPYGRDDGAYAASAALIANAVARIERAASAAISEVAA